MTTVALKYWALRSSKHGDTERASAGEPVPGLYHDSFLTDCFGRADFHGLFF